MGAISAGSGSVPAAVNSSVAWPTALSAPWAKTAGHTDPVRSRSQPNSTPSSTHAATIISTPETSVRP